jgi:hypothetical protein
MQRRPPLAPARLPRPRSPQRRDAAALASGLAGPGRPVRRPAPPRPLWAGAAPSRAPRLRPPRRSSSRAGRCCTSRGARGARRPGHPFAAPPVPWQRSFLPPTRKHELIDLPPQPLASPIRAAAPPQAAAELAAARRRKNTPPARTHRAWAMACPPLDGRSAYALYRSPRVAARPTQPALSRFSRHGVYPPVCFTRSHPARSMPQRAQAGALGPRAGDFGSALTYWWQTRAEPQARRSAAVAALGGPSLRRPPWTAPPAALGPSTRPGAWPPALPRGSTRSRPPSGS